MKKGKAYLACVWIICPYCGGEVSGENGSRLVSVNNPEDLVCDDCGKAVAMPKTIHKERYEASS